MNRRYAPFALIAGFLASFLMAGVVVVSRPDDVLARMLMEFTPIEDDSCSGTVAATSCKTEAGQVLASPRVTFNFTSSCAEDVPEAEARAEFRQLSESATCSMTALRTNSCTGGTQTVSVVVGIPGALAYLEGTSMCTFNITAFGSGIHSATSNHYRGRAIDINNTGAFNPSNCPEATLQSVICNRYGLHLYREDSANHYHVSASATDAAPGAVVIC